MPEHRHFILGTAGHIDHGKSSLVRALTGTDPDRLPEEKLRGVTIELGFAHCSLPDPDDPEVINELGVVDVPGHADFVNNMVAGVGGMDAALFVVAADDGWMPQSEEHLHILSYLGVRRGIIALTKSDLCEDIAFTSEFVRECLRDSVFADAPLVPVSSITGEGLEELKGELAALFKDASPPRDCGKPVLPVDRAFVVKGIGTVVTGTLAGGSLRTGDRLRLQPDGITGSVRAIQSHNESLESAVPGMRTALNLPDLPLASRERAGAHRGGLLTHPDAGDPHDTINVHLCRLAREIPGQSGTKRTLPNSRRVRVHHGSGSVGARVYFLDGPSLPAGESRIAQLRLDSAHFFMTGDRVVLRDWSSQSTLGGGIVLDPLARRRGFRSDPQRAFLEARAAHPDDPVALLRSALARDHVCSFARLTERLRIPAADLNAALDALVAEGRAVALDATFADAAWWQDLLAAAREEVTAFHRTQPDLPGLPLQDLRKSILPRLPDDSLFDRFLHALLAAGVNQAGTVLASEEFAPSLPDDIQKPAAAIEAALGADPLNPPGKAELASTPDARRALSFLTRAGRVTALSDKAIILTSARDDARRRVLEFLAARGKATASELRQELGTSRRIIMPLLEGMDAAGLTRRDGDLRFPV
ncbi:MAG: selenocysteine-specific translation elongation factor [Akkermansiaceae bacterium]|nr:selenocysteine-specific translation elongation factor [Akkermansiaceae bacterium]